MKIYPTAASFLISEDCNLACKYCFELTHRNKSSMSEETAVRAVEFLYENAIQEVEHNPSVDITMFGGEPFLRPDIIDAAVKKAMALRDKTEIPFSFTVITNATIMTDKIEKQFEFYNENEVQYSIQLSVDSIKKYHDEARVQRSGKGSFDLIEKNIPTFKRITNVEQDRRKLHVHGSLNDVTVPHMYEAYRYFTEVWEIPCVWFMPVEGEFWTDELASIYEEQITMIARSILDKVKATGDLTALNDYAPLNKAMRPKREFFSHPCGAGRGYCCITAAGDVYPCHQYYFTDKTTQTGDIWNGVDQKRNRFFSEFGPEDMYCTIDKNCDNYNCYRCVASYFDTTGCSLSTHYTPRCEMQKADARITEELRKVVEQNDASAANLKEVEMGCPELRTNFTNFNNEFKKIALTEVSI